MTLTPQDLDNAELDAELFARVALVNYSGPTTTNRAGTVIDTLEGRLSRIGLETPFGYVAGAEITRRSQTVNYNSVRYSYIGGLPYTLPPAFVPSLWSQIPDLEDIASNTAAIGQNTANIQANADAIANISTTNGGNSRASTQVYRFVSGTSGGVAAGQIRGNTANPSTWTTITVHNDAGDTGSIQRDSIVSDFQVGSVIQVATLPEDTNGNVTSRIYSVSARSESSDIVTYTVSELGSGNLSLPSNEDNLIIQLVGYSLATQLDTSTSDNSSSRAASSSITNAINTTATNAASAASNAQSTANSAVSSIQQANVYLLTRNGSETSLTISNISATIAATVTRVSVGRYRITGSFGPTTNYAVFSSLNTNSIAGSRPTSSLAITG